MSTPFIVKQKSGKAPLFRFYPSKSRLVLLHLGSGGQILEAVEAGLRAQLGLLGSFIMKPFTIRAKKKIEKLIKEYDSREPGAMLAQGGKHLGISVDSISHADLHGSGKLSTHYGQLILEIRGKRKYEFTLPKAEDMNTAVKVLPEILGERLVLNVKWDEKLRAYVKP